MQRRWLPPNCYCSKLHAHKRLNQLNFLTDELCIKAARRALACTVGEEFLCAFSSAQSNSSPRLSPNRMLETAHSQPLAVSHWTECGAQHLTAVSSEFESQTCKEAAATFSFNKSHKSVMSTERMHILFTFLKT